MGISTTQLKELLSKSVINIQEIVRSIKKIEVWEKDRYNNVYFIEKTINDLKNKLNTISASNDTRVIIENWLNEYCTRLESDKSELKRKFGIALENILKEKGIELKGQYPELKAGFYTIEVDFEKSKATIWYGPKQENMAQSRLSATEVAKQLENVDKILSQRTFNEEYFVKQIYESYKRTISRTGQKEGEYAPILQVLVDYVFLTQDKRFYTDPQKEYFKGYGRALFSYDLYRLHHRRILDKELSLVVATRANTLKRDSFLWVPTDDKGNGTVYSYIYFREAR